jgi:ubiquitin C-terminal hydrolase
MNNQLKDNKIELLNLYISYITKINKYKMSDIICLDEDYNLNVQESEIQIIDDIIVIDDTDMEEIIKLRSGLVNNGNQCFINASLQCLAVSPFIHDFIEKYDKIDNEIIAVISKYNLNKIKAYNLDETLIELFKNPEVTTDEKNLLTYISNRCSDFYIYISFKKVIQLLQDKVKSVLNHGFFLTVIKELSETGGFAHLFSGEQNDPHEFMVYLLDRIHAARSSNVTIDLPKTSDSNNFHVKLYIEHLKKRYEKDFSMFVKNFYYYMLNCIECDKCKNITNEVSPNDIMCLNLPNDWRTKAKLSLEDCLDDYFKVEGIDYRCEKCNNKTDNRQDRKLLTRPKTLIIKLKRYAQLGNMIVKINKMISYPPRINLAKYLCNADDKAYELYGIINHVGMMNGGHYYSFIRDYNRSSYKFSKDWMVCNDTQVNLISNDEALGSQNAYILFYHTC